MEERAPSERALNLTSITGVGCDAALASIDRDGVDALSLRALARTSGVSHAAPAHHFGDRAGLLTAIAIEGYAAGHSGRGRSPIRSMTQIAQRPA